MWLYATGLHVVELSCGLTSVKRLEWFQQQWLNLTTFSPFVICICRGATLALCHIFIIGAARLCCILLLVVLFPADENITQGTSCYAGETLLKQCCKWSWEFEEVCAFTVKFMQTRVSATKKWRWSKGPAEFILQTFWWYAGQISPLN